ncbi:MAG: ATP-dependent helicase [Bacteroidota bacterium]
MNTSSVGKLFYQQVLKIYNNSTLEPQQQIEAAYRLLNTLFVEATKKERLQFSTLFARIVYACQEYQVEGRLQLHIHHFRKAAKQAIASQAAERAYHQVVEAAWLVLVQTIEALFEASPSPEVLAIVPPSFPLSISDVEVVAFHQVIRVVVIADDQKQEQLIALDETNPNEEIRVQYNIAERNANFNRSIRLLRQYFDFPVTLNLIDVEIDTDGVYRPRAFVIEPDYLVDVSAIANCFSQAGAEPILYLLKKYLPFDTNKYLMIGNIANFFLDELMSNPEATFQETFPKIFPLYPLAFSTFEDALIREIHSKSKRHYVTLKKMVKQDFEAQGIDPKHCFLEPSFFSETYGLQGRLDVLYKYDQQSAIVELKSGKPFMPNQYGISAAHFTQTLLYDLMIQSVFGRHVDPKNYILYSVLELDQLRFAPRVKAQQFEALQVRNQLVAMEWQLKQSAKLFSKHALTEKVLEMPNIFLQVNSNRFAHIRGFAKQDIEFFEKIYRSLDKLEQKYFNAFSGFIAREHQLAKTGVEGLEQVNGQAALWRDSFSDKHERFDLMSHLSIAHNQSREDEPILIFERNEQTNPLANFRKGDIAVLYPATTAHLEDRPAVLRHQIFKCTLLELDEKLVRVRLRSKQFNTQIFEQHIFWNLEHDLFDSSFTGLYRGLFNFAQSAKSKKDLLLTRRAPRKPKPHPPTISIPKEMTQEQQGIFQKALQAEEYFLLWGPPGTGKTSMMLKHFVAHLYNTTSENILLLAYTNRAVDEICDAIESIRPEMQDAYLRIGSRFATEERFQANLLQAKIAHAKNRKDIKAVLNRHRIVVGTLSSVANKSELLALKKFQRVIIDEASQILEPMLVGFLPHFKRCILVGDHRQLPAVVTQEEVESSVQDEDLNSIGLKNLRNSFFERLYLRCKVNNWTWAYAQLSHQGRMHQDIMDFPNRHFYQGNLQVLPQHLPHYQQQIAPLRFYLEDNTSALKRRLATERFLFLPTPRDTQNLNYKTNLHEAELLADLVQCYQGLLSENEQQLHARSIGIITPYRAQIAQIREVFGQQNLPLDLLTIDTVERYQGGARDVILISLCTNVPSQLQSLVSLSEEGIDRKLNVALTRARQHLVVLGNPSLLKASPIYEALLKFCKVDDNNFN